MAEASAARTGEVVSLSKRRPFEPWRLFLEHVPTMVNEAMDERLKADEIFRNGNGRKKQNHRNFNVAASVFGIDPLERTFTVATTPNTKPTPAADKVCAETRAIKRVQKAETPMIIGMIVVGEPQADDGTGYKAETLWCCESCRLNHLCQDTEEDTLVVTMRPDKPLGQVQTAQEMINFQHGVLLGEDPVEVPTFHYLGEERWDRVLSRYDSLIPRGTDTLAVPGLREAAVQAARSAIQGYTLYT